MQGDRNKETGARIRAARVRARMSRQELADHVGRSLRAVGAWERGENLPQSLELLSVILGVDLERTETEPGGVLLQEATNGQLLGELADRLGKVTHAQTSQEQRPKTASEIHGGTVGGTPIAPRDGDNPVTGDNPALTLPLDSLSTPELGQGDGESFDNETVGSLEPFASNEARDKPGGVPPRRANPAGRRSRQSG